MARDMGPAIPGALLNVDGPGQGIFKTRVNLLRSLNGSVTLVEDINVASAGDSIAVGEIDTELFSIAFLVRIGVSVVVIVELE